MTDNSDANRKEGSYVSKDLRNEQDFKPFGRKIIGVPYRGRILYQGQPPPPPSGRYEVNQILEHLGSLDDVYGTVQRTFPIGAGFSTRKSYDEGSLEYGDPDVWIYFLQTFLLEIIRIVRLLFLVRYRTTTRNLGSFIQACVVAISRVCDRINIEVIGGRSLSHILTLNDSIQTVVRLTILGIRLGSFETNFEERLRSGIPFRPLVEEDNPFLLFCREFYSPLVERDYHSWVRLCWDGYIDQVRQYDPEDLARRRQRVLTDRCFRHIYPEPHVVTASYHFPHGFPIDDYAGPSLDPISQRYPTTENLPFILPPEIDSNYPPSYIPSSEEA